jgi:hypothetical protein
MLLRTVESVRISEPGPNVMPVPPNPDAARHGDVADRHRTATEVVEDRWVGRGLLDRDSVALELEGGARRVDYRAHRRGDRAHARLDDDPVAGRRYARL